MIFYTQNKRKNNVNKHVITNIRWVNILRRDLFLLFFPSKTLFWSQTPIRWNFLL